MAGRRRSSGCTVAVPSAHRRSPVAVARRRSPALSERGAGDGAMTWTPPVPSLGFSSPTLSLSLVVVGALLLRLGLQIASWSSCVRTDYWCVICGRITVRSGRWQLVKHVRQAMIMQTWIACSDRDRPTPVLFRC